MNIRFVASTLGLCVSLAATAQSIHPVYFKLFSPGTLYGDAVHQAVSCTDENAGDDQVLILNQAINRQIIQAFVERPWLFTTTQTAINEQQAVQQNTVLGDEKKTKELPASVPAQTAPPIDNDVNVDIVVRKPNFWAFDGNGKLQFQQNHFSDNWYQGGTDNYTLFTMLNLHAKYDNKQKLQWETTLDMKLGFQTVDNDKYRKARTNNDQLRLASKLGYRASKHWYYTVEAEAKTQFCKQYNSNSPNVISDFLSPIKTVLSVGMDYKLNLKKFTGSAFLAPVAMTWTYVDREDLEQRFGNEKGHHSKVTWGPNVKLEATWKPSSNFTWKSRLYYFSNFEYVNVEWENTLSFSFNKYIGTTFFIYPRFNDSSKSYRTKHGSYFMFKEFFSLGLEYSF